MSKNREVALEVEIKIQSSTEFGDILKTILRLSDDIEKMSKKILDMADNIDKMSGKLQGSEKRIVELITNIFKSVDKNKNTLLYLMPLLNALTELQQAIDSSDKKLTNKLFIDIEILLKGMSSKPTHESIDKIIKMIDENLKNMICKSFKFADKKSDQLNSTIHYLIDTMKDPNSDLNPLKFMQEMRAAMRDMMDFAREMFSIALEKGDKELAMELFREFLGFIREMTDKALLMADRMVVAMQTAEKVAYRMFDKMDKTEEHLLEAQLNFNKLVIGIVNSDNNKIVLPSK